MAIEQLVEGALRRDVLLQFEQCGEFLDDEPAVKGTSLPDDDAFHVEPVLRTISERVAQLVSDGDLPGYMKERYLRT